MTDVRLHYIAIRASRWREIPLTLLETLVRERCCRCHREVVADAAMLQHARAECQQRGHELQVICDKCGVRSVREADACFLCKPNRDLDKYDQG
jgi:hypothetical protein